MPFMKGRGAIRRTAEWLQKGNIMIRDNIRVVAFGFNPGQRYEHHQGLYNFVFWHLPQLKYKNPHCQYVTFKMMTPTPWIKAYIDDDSHILIDCDSRTRQEIHDHFRDVLGKTKEEIFKETQLLASRTANPANFGYTFARQCICEVPGHVPCPGWTPLPKELTGRGRKQLQEEAAAEWGCLETQHLSKNADWGCLQVACQTACQTCWLRLPDTACIRHADWGRLHFTSSLPDTASVRHADWGSLQAACQIVCQTCCRDPTQCQTYFRGFSSGKQCSSDKNHFQCLLWNRIRLLYLQQGLGTGSTDFSVPFFFTTMTSTGK